MYTREISWVIEILLSLIHSRMVLIVVCCRYGTVFDANGRVSMLISLRLVFMIVYFLVINSKRFIDIAELIFRP